MSAIAISSPLPQFFDLDGDPLDSGLLFFGAVSQNPETTPVSVYWDAAATQPAAQPLKTLNGFIARNGTPAIVYVVDAFSLTIRDSRGRLVLYTPDSTSFSNASNFSAQIDALKTQLAGGSGAASIGTAEGTNVQVELDAVQATQASQAASIATLQDRDIDAMQTFVGLLAAGTAGTAAAFGDSTMWGADPSNLAVQVAVPPYAALQNLVNNYHGNSALTVTNNAISGTTLTQMIAGTDGSGSTFAAKMAASSASVVLCNHGVNDAFGANATTAAAFKTAVLAFVHTVRANGKTPVLVTPFPSLTIGAFGSQARAEATSRFAEIVRKVASDHGVLLVDQNLLLSRLLNVDGVRPLEILPDGVHGSQRGYGIAGNNLAAALLDSQAESFTRPGQRLPSSASAIKATNQTISASSTSRVGVVSTTSTTVPETLRMVFRVDEPGLDLVLSHPVFINGSATIDVNVDGTPIGTLSMLHAGFGATFWQDYETVIVRNIAPGFHILLTTTGTVGGIGVHCLRSRETEKPLILPSGFAAPGQRKQLAPRLELNSTTANTMAVFDDCPVSFLIDAATIEWTGQMPKDSGVIIGGNVGSNSGSAACERAITIQLNPATGYLSVQEATGPGAYTSNAALSAVDQSAASHTFRAVLTNISTTSMTVQVFVDGVSIGTQALTGPFRGGLLGLWKNGAGGSLAITNVYRVWGL